MRAWRPASGGRAGGGKKRGITPLRNSLFHEEARKPAPESRRFHSTTVCGDEISTAGILKERQGLQRRGATRRCDFVDSHKI